MLDRFNPIPVFRGSWKGLADGRYGRLRPDWLARAVLGLPPAALLIFMLCSDADLKAPVPILTAVSLLAGGMLSAFTHLSTLRLKITEWLDDPEAEQDRFLTEREMMDESAAHLLAGAVACALDAALLVLGLNLSSDEKGALTGVWAALAGAGSAYVLLLFVMSVPRMYAAYVAINDVSTKLSGFAR
ncbi:hypothetical protein AB0F72_12125 [Actinoplanes sp. NPDC023936]|uniref:hypothetical protein n=1 Tax=Actinoplanes sp. NPDC023936 TaxID=3154910 RepID=UPI0033E92B96